MTTQEYTTGLLPHSTYWRIERIKKGWYFRRFFTYSILCTWLKWDHWRHKRPCKQGETLHAINTDSQRNPGTNPISQSKQRIHLHPQPPAIGVSNLYTPFKEMLWRTWNRIQLLPQTPFLYRLHHVQERSGLHWASEAPGLYQPQYDSPLHPEHHFPERNSI